MKRCSKYVKYVRECILRCFDLGIAGSAAELSYYFLFSVFPLIMTTSAVTSFGARENGLVYELLNDLLPKLVSEMLSDYYRYVVKKNNVRFLSLGLLLSMYAITRYINCIKRKIREIYDAESDNGVVREWLLSMGFSFLMVLGLYFTFMLQTVGEELLGRVAEHIPIISQKVIDGWVSVRFAAIGAYVFLLLVLTYKTIPTKGLSYKRVLKGAVFSTASWILLSILFAFYVDNVSNYYVMYGSIGAFIVLMLWLYLINVIILTGAVINRVAEDMNYEKKHFL